MQIRNDRTEEACVVLEAQRAELEDKKKRLRKWQIDVVEATRSYHEVEGQLTPELRSYLCELVKLHIRKTQVKSPGCPAATERAVRPTSNLRPDPDTWYPSAAYLAYDWVAQCILFCKSGYLTSCMALQILPSEQ